MMKTACFAVVLLALLPFASSGEVRLGAKRGLHASSLIGEGPVPSSFASGPAMGLQGSLTFASFFGLQAELLVSQRGGKFKDALGQDRIFLNYLDIPLLVRYVLVFSQSELAAYVGFIASRVMGGNIEHVDAGGTIKAVIPWSAMNPWDYGFALGAEYGISFEVYRLYLEGRFSMGFVPPFNNAYRNIAISLFLGYELKF